MPLGSSCLSAQSSVPALQRDSERVYCFDGLTVLVIKTDVTYTVTHQTTQILTPAGPPKRSRRERHEAVRTAARTLPIMTSGEGVLRWVTPRGPAASDATFGCGRACASACSVYARPNWARALLYKIEVGWKEVAGKLPRGASRRCCSNHRRHPPQRSRCPALLPPRETWSSRRHRLRPKRCLWRCATPPSGTATRPA